jgi:hypothetical protein
MSSIINRLPSYIAPIYVYEFHEGEKGCEDEPLCVTVMGRHFSFLTPVSPRREPQEPRDKQLKNRRSKSALLQGIEKSY